jgi:hypothetical protein
MPTPTISHIDPPASPCGCTLFRLCTTHFATEQKRAARLALQSWAESYGAREVRTERQRPALMVVR